MSQPIRSELSVASTEEFAKEVEKDLEEKDVDWDAVASLMENTKGGTRTQRLAAAKRKWEQDQKTKKSQS